MQDKKVPFAEAYARNPKFFEELRAQTETDGPSPDLLPGESRLLAGPDCPNGVQVTTRVRWCTLDKLFTIALNDKNADTKISDILSARFAELNSETHSYSIINLTFERCRIDDDDMVDRFHLSVVDMADDFQAELWEQLSALRILGFCRIVEHQS